MRIVIALGGNALLRRGEPLTEENQRRNIAVAAASLAPFAQDNTLVITHGNGPQVEAPMPHPLYITILSIALQALG